MELSPSGSLLATVDVLGNISLYDVPSLRLRKQWSAEEQVGQCISILLHCVGQFDDQCISYSNTIAWC